MPFADLLLVAVMIALLAYSGAFAMMMRRSPNPALGISLLLLPYWTLVGSVPVLLAKAADPGAEYSYLEHRLFPITADRNYAIVLLAYIGFLGGVVVVVSTCTRREPAAERQRLSTLWRLLAERFSHALLLLAVGLMMAVKLALAVYLVRSVGSTSLYTATRIVRGSNASALRVYQYLNDVSVFPLAAAFVLWLSFPHARLARRTWSRGIIWSAYLILLLVSVAENALLGNRAVPLIVMGAIAAGWLRWRFMVVPRGNRAPLVRRFALVAFLGLLSLGTIGISRGGSLDTPSAVVGSLRANVVQVGNVVVQSTRSSEKLAAHMSLYGVLSRPEQARDVLASNSYAEYAAFVDAPPDQVFTVHYLTAWWLRLGPMGLAPAILTFGLAMAVLQRLATRFVGLLGGGFALAAATLPAAGVPIVLLRSGPESLRGVFVELLLLPALVLTPCFLFGRPRSVWS